MRGTAPSSHWRISAPHVPIHQFASTKPLTKHTLHTYLNARHKTHGIVIQIQQPYSTLSFDTPPWIISITQSSQCHAPSWHAHINQSPHPDLASVMRPHGSPPQINSIAPIQLCAPLEYPHKSISSFTSSQCRTPMSCPRKSIPSLWSSRAPMTCPSQCHTPMACPLKSIPSPRSSCVPHDVPHKSIPSPWSSPFCMPHGTPP